MDISASLHSVSIKKTESKTTVQKSKDKETSEKPAIHQETTKEVMYKGLLIRNFKNVSGGPVENQNAAIQRGLEILQEAMKHKIEGVVNVATPEEHIRKAQEYGSFDAYYEAEWTPEKVSGRILGFALSQFSSYAKQHPNASKEELANGFSKLLSGAVQKGYDDAMKVLGEDFDPEIIAELEKTLKLTLDGIESWKQEFLGIKPEDHAEAASA